MGPGRMTTTSITVDGHNAKCTALQYPEGWRMQEGLGPEVRHTQLERVPLVTSSSPSNKKGPMCLAARYVDPWAPLVWRIRVCLLRSVNI